MTYQVRVYYEDTDVSGVAYHANYLRWFERARTEWLRDLGFNQQVLIHDAGVGFTVASLEVRYLQPARLDDELVVHTRVRALGKASIRFEQVIHKSTEERPLLATASVKVGCVDVIGFQPRRMPTEIEDAINKDMQAP